MTTVHLPDEASRSQMANDLDTSVFVEAGAGTGKTSSLVSRIVNTLANRDDPISVRELAAITFTERAASELRSRVRGELVKRASAGGGDQVEHALRDVDAAEIGTIHGFALAILREHSLAAALPVGFSVVDDATAKAQQRQRWRDVHARLQGGLSPAVHKILVAAGIRLLDLEALATDVDKNRARLASHDVDWGYRADAWQAVALIATDLRDFAESALAECTDEADKLAIHFRSWVLPLCDRLDQIAALSSEDAVDSMIAILRGWPARKDADQDSDIGWSKTFYPGTVGTARSWGSLTPKDVRADLKAFETDLRDILFAPVEDAMRDVLDVIWAELDAQCGSRRAEGLLEFDDLLLMARDLLADDSDVRGGASSLPGRHGR